MLFMFLNDALVTAGSSIIREGASINHRIALELFQEVNDPLQAQVETKLKTKPIVELPINTVISNLTQNNTVGDIIDHALGSTKRVNLCSRLFISSTLSTFGGTWAGNPATSSSSATIFARVTSPGPRGSQIGLVVTQSNPTAKFLGSLDSVYALLLWDCCLNFALLSREKRGSVMLLL